MRTIRDSRVFAANEAIDLARKIKWLKINDYQFAINLAKGVDNEDVVVLLWEEIIEEEAVEGEPLD